MFFNDRIMRKDYWFHVSWTPSSNCDSMSWQRRCHLQSEISSSESLSASRDLNFRSRTLSNMASAIRLLDLSVVLYLVGSFLSDTMVELYDYRPDFRKAKLCACAASASISSLYGRSSQQSFTAPCCFHQALA